MGARCACLLLVLLLASPARPCAAQADGPGAASHETPLRYFEVLVPKSDYESYARGLETVSREKFESLLQAARAAEAGRVEGALLTRAEYTAVWTGTGPLRGTATLHWQATGGASQWLSLDPWNLALSGEPRYQAETAVYFGGTLEGIGGIVTGSGRWETEWLLRGEADGAGRRFRLRLPPALVGKLILDLPAGYVPEANVLAERRGEQGSLWELELGGVEEVDLVLSPLPDPDSPTTLTWRQSTTYDLSPRSIEISSEILLQDLDGKREPLPISLDAGVIPLAARWNGRAISWRLNEAGDELLAVLPPGSGGGALRVEAMLAPTAEGKLVELPTLAPAIAGWQESVAHVRILEPRGLSRFSVDGARLVQSEKFRGDRGTLLRFQAERPKPRISVATRSRGNVVFGESATTLEFRTAETEARLVADLRTEEEAVHSFHLSLDPAWQVRGVQGELLPADPRAPPSPGEIGVAVHWSRRASDAGSDRYELALARPLTRDQRLRVNITARREVPPLESSLPLASWLAFAELREVRFDRRLGVVRVEPPRWLHNSRELELVRLPVSALSEADATRFNPAGATIFDRGELAPEFTAVLSSTRPRYRGEITVRAEMRPDHWLHEVTVQCLPQTQRVDRLLVHFSNAAEEPVAWRVLGEPGLRLDAHRLTPEQLRAINLDTRGETWQVSFPEPRGEAFTLRGLRRHNTRENDQPLALVSLPEAESQNGTLLVAAEGMPVPRVEVQNLSALPLPPASPQEFNRVCARLRYDPNWDPQVVWARAVWSERTTGDDAWIWNATLLTRLAGERAVHRLLLHVENTGAAELAVEIPPEVGLIGVWVEGVDHSPGEPGTDLLRVPLPPEARFPQVRIDFATETTQETLGCRITPHTPRPRAVVLQRRWQVWHPDHLEPYSMEHGKSGLVRRAFSLLPAGDVPGGSFLLTSNWAGAPRRGASATAAQELLGLVERALGEARRQPNGDWRRFFTELETQLALASDQLPQGLLVDSAALREIGVEPAGLVHSAVDSGDSVGGAEQLLRRVGVVFLLSDEVVFLTSGRRLAGWDDHVELFPGTPVAVLRSTELKGAIEQPSHPRALGVPVARWRSSGIVDPWPMQGDEAEAPLAQASWRFREVPWTESREGLFFIRRREVAAFGWGLFFAAAGLATSLGRRRANRLPFLLAGAGVALIFLPEPLAPLGSALLLGALLGCLLSLTPRSRMEGEPVVSLGEERATETTAALPLLLLAAVTLLPTEASAQLTSPGARLPQGPPYPVIVPVDEQLQPADRYVYLPQDFFEELKRRAKVETNLGPDWILTRADYQGVLEHEAEATGALFEISYDLQVFRGGEVSLPLPRNALALLEGGVRWNSEPIEVDWRPEGPLRFKVERPGRGRLQVTARVAVVDRGEEVEVDLPVPRALRAVVRVQQMGRVAPLTFPTAQGEVLRYGAESAAALGTADRLTFSWPRVSESPPAEGEVQQLLWLRLAPGSVTADFRFKVRLLSGAAEELYLQVDPAWRALFPNEAVNAFDLESEGTPGRYRLRFANPITGEVVVRGSLVLRDTSGVGRFRPPRAAFEGLNTVRRWVGVSVESPLVAELPAHSTTLPLTIEAFLTGWGEGALPPLAALSLPEGADDWEVATRMSGSKLTVHEHQRLAVDLETLELGYEAEIEVEGSPVFQHVVSGPRNWQITSAFLRQGETDTPLEVSGDERGHRYLLVPGGQRGRAVLQLSGSLPVKLATEVPLPEVRYAAGNVRRRTVSLYRGDAVAVELRPEPLLPPPVSFPPDLADWGRRISAWEETPDAPHLVEQPRPQLVIHPNHPRVTGVQVVRWSHVGSLWRAEVECRLQAEGGEIDTLRLIAPTDWQLGEVTDLAAEISERPLADGRLREIKIRPRRALRGDFSFRLRGVMQSPPFRDGRIPQFQPLEVAERNLDQYVVFPVQFESHLVHWETQGLRPAPLPGALSPIAPQRETSYQVIGSPARATFKIVQVSAGVEQVRLADLQVRLEDDEQVVGVAAYYLEPVGKTSFLIQAPAPVTLVHASVDDLPAPLEPLTGGRYRIGISASLLPRKLALVFRGRRLGGALPVPPYLVDVPVERTLWTIHPCAGQAEFPGAEETPRVSELQQHAQRLRSLCALVDLNSNVLADLSTDELRSWYQGWGRRIVACQREAVRTQHGAPRRPAEMREIDAWMAEHAVIAARLGTADLLQQFEGESADGAALKFSDLRLHPHSTSPICFNYRGWQPQAPAVAPPSPGMAEALTAFRPWLLAAALFIAALSPLPGWTARWARKHPAVVLVIVGALWGLFAPFPLAGLGVLAAGVVGLAARLLPESWGRRSLRSRLRRFEG